MTTPFPTRRPLRLARLLAGCVLALHAAFGLAQETTTLPPGIEVKSTGDHDKSVTLNLNNADLTAFISAISELTGKNFVVDPRVKGQVTVISAAPTDPNALYEVFLSVLKVHGYAAVPSGKVIKIMPDINARSQGAADLVQGRPQDSERIVTAVIPTQYLNVAELVPLLRPLLPQEAHLAASATADALIIADTASNVDRIMRIVRDLDRDNAFDIEVIPLRNAEARELVTTLQSLPSISGEPQAPGRQSPIAADERSNSVLIGGPPAVKNRLRSLITALDVPKTAKTDVIEVVYLRFARAKDLVELLHGVGDYSYKQATESGGKGGGAQQAPILPTAGGSGAGGFQVLADEATNALVLQAKPELLVQLKQVIKSLDIRRAQVLVEGIVAEVSSTKADELGIQWKTALNSDGVFAGQRLPGTSAGAITSPFDTTATPGFGTGLTLGYFSAGDLRALIRALSGDQYTNVLSTPTLMTLDNAEAKIVVGQNVPFVTGQFTNSTTTSLNPFQTIERKDIGILLKVKPQINEGDTLTLAIEQEVSSVDRTTTASDLVTNKRAISTTVLVDNRQIVVLGGLISDDLTHNRQKVPLLGDVPLLGQLFRNDASDYKKTNLMVFLRPTIVRDRETNRELTGARYEDLRVKQSKQDKEQSFFLRRQAGPSLPADGLAE
ncbi:MAG: type II secretion system secretin GspD [Gammaproteobacteria bacterium]|nr:type II secretion system secretin GspD [Gammaproteobacteria bacterium]MBI5614718.1 type II secretion system secretin GspD [Gammaproteobacteria bacterium]